MVLLTFCSFNPSDGMELPSLTIMDVMSVCLSVWNSITPKPLDPQQWMIHQWIPYVSGMVFIVFKFKSVCPSVRQRPFCAKILRLAALRLQSASITLPLLLTHSNRPLNPPPPALLSSCNLSSAPLRSALLSNWRPVASASARHTCESSLISSVCCPWLVAGAVNQSQVQWLVVSKFTVKPLKLKKTQWLK